MNSIFAVYGAAGCGRSLMPVAHEQLRQGDQASEIIFIDDGASDNEMINGRKVISYQDFKSLNYEKKSVLIAIANSAVRERIAAMLIADSVSLWSVVSDKAVVMDNVIIGEGAAVSPFVTIGSNVSIGKGFHANIYSYVEHDCIIGNYVTLAPRASCNGNIHIKDHAYIGAGAVIKQGTSTQPLTIGEGAVVGMGAVVTKDVPAGMVVVGNPARELDKRR